MTTKELFNDNRPLALLNPAASRRLDPRFTFTRAGIATYINDFKELQTASANQPRINRNPAISSTVHSLLLEPAGTNFLIQSNTLSSWYSRGATATQDGTKILGVEVWKITATATLDHHYVAQNAGQLPTMYSIYVRRGNTRYVTIGSWAASVLTLLAGTAPDRRTILDFDTGLLNTSLLEASAENLGNDTYKITIAQGYTGGDPGAGGISVHPHVTSASPSQYTGASEFVYAGLVQSEGSAAHAIRRATSYIATTTVSLSRAADLLTLSAALGESGSIYIDALPLSIQANNVVISAANASNQKINLGYESRAETYNSTTLIASYNGNVKATLPLPVPSLSRERNIFTWGANNYQHGFNVSRFAPSLAASVPANLNRLSIGHDAVDPTKAFHGYVNSVYIWSGEMPPEIAEALVRSNLDAINADTYVPTGPADALSLIINTQGAGSSGDRVFVLPASRASYASTALTVGETYRILTVGTTNWTLVGAASSAVGVIFVATGTTTGSGTAAWQQDFVVTWGDGTESGLEGAAGDAGAAGLTKTYSSAGIYPIWLSDRLQDLVFNNSASAPDLLRIEAWGTDKMFTKPSTMANAFNGCSRMDFGVSARNPATFPDTSAVTIWTAAFLNCSSITGAFPAFNFSAATLFNATWQNCSGITSWPAVDTQTQNVTNFANAWYGCSSLTSFPLINTAAGTNFSSTWDNCTSLTSFPLINTAATTVLSYTWYGCSSLTSFPLINTAAVTNMSGAWGNCSSLTSFPLINTAAVTSMSGAWQSCSNLTSFPTINTAAVTALGAAWDGCSDLTSFPLLNTAAVTSLDYTWRGCTSLTSFPLIIASAVTNMIFTWANCTGLTSFPLINTAAVTNFSSAWNACSSLTSFPLINTAAGTFFNRTWTSCSSLTSFPLINTAAGTNFTAAWASCSSLTSFPSLSLNAATGSTVDTGFDQAWQGCTLLATFPASRFNTTTATRFLNAFSSCALTAASIENIIVSINTAGTSNGTLSLQGGTNAGAGTWTGPAVTAYNALISRGWTITRNA